MPITRRKRATPPPEDNNQATDQQQNEAAVVEQAATEAPASPVSEPVAPPSPPAPAEPMAEESVAYQTTPAQLPAVTPQSSVAPFSAAVNGERIERSDRERPEYTPVIEGGRRTSFRRTVQQQLPPSPTPAPIVSSTPPLQAPSHEIKLPLGKEPGDTNGDPLHLAYNPSYTGSDEARSALLHQLAQESKSGGRARCWNCGSLAIVYERWNTRSKAFGEVGIAFCEICGVWSVM